MGKRSTVYNDGLTARWDEVNPKNQKLYEKFLRYARSIDLSPQTIYQYGQQLKVFFCFILEQCDNKFFVDLKKSDLIEYSYWLQTELKVSGSRISTLRSVISSLSKYIEDTLDDEYPNFRNISSVIKISNREPVREKTVMSEDDVQRTLDILVSQKKYQVACFLALLVASGMRRSETIQMKVDFFTEKNKVLRNMFYLTPKIRTKGKGTEGKKLPKYVIIKMFQPYFDMWMKEREEKGIKNEELFVVYKDGNYIPASISTVDTWAKKIKKISGLEYYNHCSRHYFTTFMNEQKFTDTEIKTLVGWESVDMVRRYDDHTSEQQLEGAIDRFAKAFGFDDEDEDEEGE